MIAEFLQDMHQFTSTNRGAYKDPLSRPCRNLTLPMMILLTKSSTPLLSDSITTRSQCHSPGRYLHRIIQKMTTHTSKTHYLNSFSSSGGRKTFRQTWWLVVVVEFTLLFKNKGSSGDPKGLLNHTYKLLSNIILESLLSPTDRALPQRLTDRPTFTHFTPRVDVETTL